MADRQARSPSFRWHKCHPDTIPGQPDSGCFFDVACHLLQPLERIGTIIKRIVLCWRIEIRQIQPRCPACRQFLKHLFHPARGAPRRKPDFFS